MRYHIRSWLRSRLESHSFWDGGPLGSSVHVRLPAPAHDNRDDIPSPKALQRVLGVGDLGGTTRIGETGRMRFVGQVGSYSTLSGRRANTTRPGDIFELEWRLPNMLLYISLGCRPVAPDAPSALGTHEWRTLVRYENVVTLIAKSERVEAAARGILTGNDWSALYVSGLHQADLAMLWPTQESSDSNVNDQYYGHR